MKGAEVFKFLQLKDIIRRGVSLGLSFGQVG